MVFTMIKSTKNKALILLAFSSAAVHAGQVASTVSSAVRKNPRAAAVVVATGIGAAGFVGGLALGRERAATLNAQLQLAQQEIAQLNENTIKFRLTLNSNEAGSSSKVAPCAYVDYAFVEKTATGQGQIFLQGNNSQNLYRISHLKTKSDNQVLVTVTHSEFSVVGAVAWGTHQYRVDDLATQSFVESIGLPKTVAAALQQLAIKIGAKEGLWELTDNN